MGFLKKNKKIRDSQTTELETIQLWEVVWHSRHGGFSRDIKRQVEVFTSEEQAKEFYQAVIDAYSLLKYTNYPDVTIGKHN